MQKHRHLALPPIVPVSELVHVFLEMLPRNIVERPMNRTLKLGPETLNRIGVDPTFDVLLLFVMNPVMLKVTMF